MKSDVLTLMEQQADAIIEETNRQLAQEKLQALMCVEVLDGKYRDHRLHDRSDRIAAAVVDTVEEYVGGNVIWSMDAGDRIDMLMAAATTVREGLKMGAALDQCHPQEEVSMEGYELAAAPIAKSAPLAKPTPLQEVDTFNRQPYVQFYTFQESLNKHLDAYAEPMQDFAVELVDAMGKEGLTAEEAIEKFETYANSQQPKLRKAEQLEYFQVAEKWGNRRISSLEAAHGVAREFYLKFHQYKGSPEVLGDEYNALFDASYYQQIEARKVRAAHELFGQ